MYGLLILAGAMLRAGQWNVLAVLTADLSRYTDYFIADATRKKQHHDKILRILSYRL